MHQNQKGKRTQVLKKGNFKLKGFTVSVVDLGIGCPRQYGFQVPVRDRWNLTGWGPYQPRAAGVGQLQSPSCVRGVQSWGGEVAQIYLQKLLVALQCGSSFTS